jgi:glycosyltransferase involved in cell wall biosynthesis
MISVCMATFNGEKYIFDQIMSILPQLGDEDELIISDDGSNDKTLSIIHSINSDKIRVVSGPRQGLIKNFEHALSFATGEYIFLSDQDDLWMNNKVDEICKVFLEQNCDLIVSDCEVIDENLNVVIPSFFIWRKSGTGIFKNLYKNTYLGCCMAFKRTAMNKCLPFPECIPMHDWWLGLNTELSGTTYFLNRPLVRYRRHGNNCSPTSTGKKTGLKSIFFTRLFLLLELIKIKK